MNEWTDGRMDGLMDRRMEKWISGRMDRSMDERMEGLVGTIKYYIKFG